MSYSKTSCTGAPDMIGQFVAFAVANAGFTNQGTVGSGATEIWRISKGGIYWYFKFSTVPNRILFRMSYVLGTVWPTAANGPTWDTIMSMWAFGGPFTNLYMYSDGDTCNVAVELTNGIFTHLSFGNITKTEVFTGGEYTAATGIEQTFTSAGTTFYFPVNQTSTNNPFMAQLSGATFGASVVRAVPLTGGFSDQRDFTGLGVGVANNQVSQGSAVNGINERIMRDIPNLATLRTPMLPLYIFIRDPVSLLYRQSGYIASMRLVPVRYLDPASIVYTEWQTFPMTQKDGAGIVCPNSANYGLAYHRVP